MGIDINALRYLIRSKQQGVELGNVLTVGRLTLDVNPTLLAQELRSQVGIAAQPKDSEALLMCLGAKSVTSLDASNYEGAEIVHDLNFPVPLRLLSQYDTVYDGGTTEHVFNFPMAIRNCMGMLRVGGRLFMHSPANNWMGHGLYQLSPELLYGVLSQVNGFNVEEMVAHRLGPNPQWYSVPNPREIKRRVELISFTMVALITRAYKIGTPSMARLSCPQQSDYERTWNEGAPSPARKSKLRQEAEALFPRSSALIKAASTAVQLYRDHSLMNRRVFTPINYYEQGICRSKTV